MDARQRRSRQKLQSAVYELASIRPVNEITVSEVAALAGVNRSTFYEHATSPSALLEGFLRAELDAIRERFLAGVDEAHAPDSIAETTRAVLVHVEQHAAIYRLGLGETSGAASLRPMLGAHFEASIGLLVEQHSVTIGGDAAPSPELARYAAKYISNGTVGVIAAWVDSAEPDTIDEVLRVYRLLLPEWWPLAG